MDNIRAAAIHADLQAVLKDFAEKHGLTTRGVNTKWSADGIRTGIVEFADKNSDLAVDAGIDPTFIRDFLKSAWQHELTEEMLGKEYTLMGKNGLGKFKLLGMRASKLMFQEVKTGQQWRFNASVAPKIVAQFKAM